MKYTILLILIVTFFHGCSGCKTCKLFPNTPFNAEEKRLLDRLVLKPENYPKTLSTAHLTYEPFITAFISSNPNFVDLTQFQKSLPDHPLGKLKAWYQAIFYDAFYTFYYSVMVWPTVEDVKQYLGAIQEPLNGMKKIYRAGTILLIFDFRDKNNAPLAFDPNHALQDWIAQRIHILSE